MHPILRTSEYAIPNTTAAPGKPNTARLESNALGVPTNSQASIQIPYTLNEPTITDMMKADIALSIPSKLAALIKAGHPGSNPPAE